MHPDKSGGSSVGTADPPGDAGPPASRYGAAGGRLRITSNGWVDPIWQGIPAQRPIVEPAAEAAPGPFRADPDRLSDTLSALAVEHRIPGAQVAIHYRGETVTRSTAKRQALLDAGAAHVIAAQE